jgi:hypothetical protein
MVKPMNDDFKFNTIEELYARVLPALTSKVNEFKREKISYITEKDIWNFLSNKTWRVKKDLEFYELIDSIINLPLSEMDSYLVNKMNPKNEKNIILDDSIL